MFFESEGETSYFKEFQKKMFLYKRGIKRLEGSKLRRGKAASKVKELSYNFRKSVRTLVDELNSSEYSEEKFNDALLIQTMIDHQSQN
jgi:hypothetical protein